MSNIAFIGLGKMGAPMAANLVKAGRTVKGFDLVEAAKTAAAASGVAIAASASEAVAGADTVVTMLPAGKHVLAAHADFLSAVPKGALVIDCSTIDVDSARKAHEAGAAAGVLTLDAPVSGGVGGATGATLTFMCGGSDEAFARAKPILENMGKRIVH
ncbi:MAG TPA: NAD(P)-binding domain-containing protein, partial [Roseiarcus sp.]